MKYINMSGYEVDEAVPKKNPSLVNYAVRMDVYALMFNGDSAEKKDMSGREVKDITVFIGVDPELEPELAIYNELYKSAVCVIDRMSKSEFESCHVTIEKVSSITRL